MEQASPSRAASSTTGSTSAGAEPARAPFLSSGAGVVAADFSLRDGGRGRGFERREDARSSVSVGRCRSGVEGTGRPFAFPRPLPEDTGRGGVLSGEVTCGGVDGGGGALESRSCSGTMRGLFDGPAREEPSDGGVRGRLPD